MLYIFYSPVKIAQYQFYSENYPVGFHLSDVTFIFEIKAMDIFPHDISRKCVGIWRADEHTSDGVSLDKWEKGQSPA